MRSQVDTWATFLGCYPRANDTRAKIESVRGSECMLSRGYLYLLLSLINLSGDQDHITSHWPTDDMLLVVGWNILTNSTMESVISMTLLELLKSYPYMYARLKALSECL